MVCRCGSRNQDGWEQKQPQVSRDNVAPIWGANPSYMRKSTGGPTCPPIRLVEISLRQPTPSIVSLCCCSQTQYHRCYRKRESRWYVLICYGAIKSLLAFSISLRELRSTRRICVWSQAYSSVETARPPDAIDGLQ